MIYGWIALSTFWTTGASPVRKIIWRLVWRNCMLILGLKGLTSADTSSSFIMCKISLCLPYNDNKNDAPSEHVFASLFYLFWYCFPDVLDLLAFCAFHEWGYIQNLLVFYLTLSQLFYFRNVREGCGKPRVKCEGTRTSLCSHKLKLHDVCFNASPC